jgi:hypothetical protein
VEDHTPSRLDLEVRNVHAPQRSLECGCVTRPSQNYESSERRT